MSEGGVTVPDMSKHICVYFDDGDLEPGCVCGERVVVIMDEHGVEAVAVLEPTLVEAAAA